MDWDAINELLKAKQFQLGATMPMAWKLAALILKHAADRLFDIQHDAALRIISPSVQEAQNASLQAQSASGLKQLAGRELEDRWDSELISVYYFLMGCSTENLLKGILMSQHPEYLEAETKLTHIKSHDLVKLCSRCNIDLVEKEKELLEKLTTYVKWAGRYPVPLSNEDMFPKKKADGTWVQRGDAFRGYDTQTELDQIWIRLWEELERSDVGD